MSYINFKSRKLFESATVDGSNNKEVTWVVVSKPNITSNEDNTQMKLRSGYITRHYDADVAPIYENINVNYLNRTTTQKIIFNNAILSNVIISGTNLNLSIDEMRSNVDKLCADFIELSGSVDVKTLSCALSTYVNEKQVETLAYVDDKLDDYIKDGEVGLIIGNPENVQTYIYYTPESGKETEIKDIAGMITFSDIGKTRDEDQNTTILKVEIGKDVTAIDEKCFMNCLSIDEVVIPESITLLYNSSFNNCRIKKIEIPESVINIGAKCFYCCIKLQEIKINGNSIFTLNNNTFQSCIQLSSIQLPQTLIRINQGCFYNCTSLLSIELPENLKTLEKTVFKNCSSLKYVKFNGNNLEYLPEEVFESCSSLKTINIPDSITKIQEQCFRYCTSLQSISIPDDVEYIHWECFEGCTSLSNVQFGNTIQYLGEQCFKDCASLSTIALPQQLSSIENRCFKNCSSLISIDFQHIAPEKISTAYGCFDGCMSLSNVILPNGTSLLPKEFFRSCKSLQTIVLPNGMTNIDEYCFDGCTSLSNIDIPTSITTLGAWCFGSCSSLLSICIPDSVTDINTNCFANCLQLDEMHFENEKYTVANISANANAYGIGVGRTTQSFISCYCNDGTYVVSCNVQ